MLIPSEGFGRWVAENGPFRAERAQYLVPQNLKEAVNDRLGLNYAD
jgi:hypothetical protein